MDKFFDWLSLKIERFSRKIMRFILPIWVQNKLKADIEHEDNCALNHPKVKEIMKEGEDA